MSVLWVGMGDRSGGGAALRSAWSSRSSTVCTSSATAVGWSQAMAWRSGMLRSHVTWRLAKLARGDDAALAEVGDVQRRIGPLRAW